MFISRQLIYNFPEQMFTAAGVMAIEHADFEGVERLALVLGAEITSTFDHPELTKLGHADLIEEIVIGEDKLIRFSGVEKGEACSIILRGASQQILDEAERSLHDALCVLAQTTKVGAQRARGQTPRWGIEGWSCCVLVCRRSSLFLFCFSSSSSSSLRACSPLL